MAESDTNEVLSFDLTKVKRKTLVDPLTADARKNARLSCGADMLRGYNPNIHVFEVIRRNRKEGEIGVKKERKRRGAN